MTAKYSKTYLDYLNKLVNQYKNTYHRSIDKETIDANHFDLIEDTESIHKTPNFKTGDKFFSKGYTKRWFKRNICHWFCIGN